MSLRVVNYIVVCLAVLGVLFCWVQYLEAKRLLSNPLIPQGLMAIHFKRMVLFTALFLVVAMLQLLAVYFRKGRLVAAVFGIIVIAAAVVFYPLVIGWFLE
ncbi:hypothetical protein AM493_19600 [Flavobacterium akiainvivens]|uniref:Uncharacterized protein n=1 Tax=Flavobacterium akiainvivens TaxID=1202724 RepID=A0A0M9VJR0_9FLAO|nr:hypothetical protein [Flavobacterium akiainvivens]KOS08010.1 hypothetical protein AM493_19600 [Flavobacterium akiainvivens]